MIFYFTGTGNSLMAAKLIAPAGERFVDMADARKKGEFHYEIAEGERVGFVFPVYCYTIGDAVVDFLEKAEIVGADYVFAVLTCGGGMGGAAVYLRKLLEKKGITLSYASAVVMPDNTVFYWNIASDEKIEDRLELAKDRLADIRADLAERTVRPPKGLSTGWLRTFYHWMTGTKKFHVTDSCIGCGLCERICPESAIEIKEGRPVWVKKDCTKCAGCINRCPKGAIQYGSGTAKRRRYVNPVLKGKY